MLPTFSHKTRRTGHPLQEEYQQKLDTISLGHPTPVLSERQDVRSGRAMMTAGSAFKSSFNKTSEAS